MITGNTFHTVEDELRGIPCRLTLLSGKNQSEEKGKYIHSLGAEKTGCIGNGRNDRVMLHSAVIGISLLQTEGLAVESLLSVDVVCRNIGDALDLLLQPIRLKATLRG